MQRIIGSRVAGQSQRRGRKNNSVACSGGREKVESRVARGISRGRHALPSTRALRVSCAYPLNQSKVRCSGRRVAKSKVILLGTTYQNFSEETWLRFGRRLRSRRRRLRLKLRSRHDEMDHHEQLHPCWITRFAAQNHRARAAVIEMLSTRFTAD